MELFLSVTYPTSFGMAPLDVSVELDPFTSVGVLRDALEEFGARRAQREAGSIRALAVLGAESPVVLDNETSVFEAELVSGALVGLLDDGSEPRGARGSRHPSPAGPSVSLDITSGPEAGRMVVIGPGRHVMGRSSDCDVVIDDPTMSRSHLTIEVSSTLGVVIHPDPQATNGTFVATAVAREPLPLAPEEAVFAGSSQFVLRAARYDTVGARDRLGQIAFNRLPYRRPIVRERILDELEPPPSPPGQRRFSIVAVLVPLIGSIGIVLITKRIEFVLLAGLSPLMMVSNYFSEGRYSKRTYAVEKEKFLAQAESRATEIDQTLAQERQERMAAAPDVPMLGRQAAGRLNRLWERHRGTPDFLELRLGLGNQPTKVKTTIRSGGDPELRKPALERLAYHETLELVPVVIGVGDAGVAGLHGDPAQLRGLVASLSLQAAVLHSPEDLVIASAVPTAEEGAWSWLKWLPHTRSATSPLEGPHLVNESRTDDLLLRLMSVVRARTGHPHSESTAWPQVLLVLHERANADGPLLATLLDVAAKAGIIVIWVGHSEHQLPRHCRAIVRCAPATSAESRLRFTDPSIDDQLFDLEGISVSLATTMARSLAPVRDVSAATATTAIPRVVPLLDALDIPVPSGEVLLRRWRAQRPYGLQGSIGMAPDGPFTIDLVDQGPHTLIAGTSGAGKSELLQTLVLALAVQYPPEKVNFLFIDYKGGALSADFRALPHSVGSVTNLDERLSLRALASLRAELRRRMTLLEGRAKDLADMLRVAPADAPPSLVIVVDEFATLVKEIPDFVAGIVDIAQRGRSLGIHLILATQRPTGAVNDNILANTNLRIALRVLDSADSTAVVGAKDAAEIPVPLRGRAFARTGPGALSAFQCAWSGAPFEPEAQASPAVVRPFRFVDREPSSSPSASASEAESSVETQLSLTVRACAEAAELAGAAPPRKPWVEPLPEIVSLGALPIDTAHRGGKREDPGRVVTLGLGDAPQDQSQFLVTVDLEASGGLIVFGAGGSGKTTLLRTVAAGLAQQGTPDEVRILALDFAARSLSQLEALPHTVAVAAGDELERVTRILTVLRRELDSRRRLLADADAETLSALRAQAGAPVMPRLVVLLDSYAGFHATFEQGPLYGWVTDFQRLVTEGRQMGIHVVMTTNRQLGVPTALTSAMGARVVLRMVSAEELIGLGVPRNAALGAELTDGRGFINGGAEIQVATVSDDPLGAAQAREIATLAGQSVAAGVTPAPGLPELPEMARLPRSAYKPLICPLGLADLSLEPVEVDLSRQNLIILGPPRSGRSTATETAMASLTRTAKGPRLIGLGGLTSPLASLEKWHAAGFGRSRQPAALEEAMALVEGYEGDEVKVVLVMDSVEDLESMENNQKLDVLLRSDAVRLVAVVEPATLSRAYSGWLAELKRNRAVLVLQPGTKDDVEAVAGAKPNLRPEQPFPPGRGVLVDHGRPVLVQVAVGTSAGQREMAARKPDRKPSDGRRRGTARDEPISPRGQVR